ncbi:DUF58 domain-containing protein [Actinotalea sp.]|uniref:DUF58 domain-containing protein n=1 Tax=Actinotalea sp. TaxID=1872145 RepID=UPI0035640108
MRSVLAGLRPTRRGLGMVGTGAGALISGTAIGVPTLVTLGLVLLLSALGGLALLLVDIAMARHGRIKVARLVHPHPLSVGDEARVQVEVTATGATRLDRLSISERAARELSSGGAPRARVTRAPHRLTLSYPITGVRRGRWRAGPLEVRRTDLLGTLSWHGPLGAQGSVAVRPRVVPLAHPRSSAALDTSAATGSRTSAPDDTALREYRPGDDLRRVHWASSARVGTLVVRQDEQSGRRPATVLLELPVEPDAVEWTISTGVSIAGALLDGGHPVRILVAGKAPLHRGPGAQAFEEMLDDAVDLTPAPDRVTSRAWLMDGLDSLAAQGAGRELVAAVLGSVDRRTLADLARLGSVHEGWALIRTDGHPTATEITSIDTLRRGGWAAVAADLRTGPQEAWSLALGLHDEAAAER